MTKEKTRSVSSGIRDWSYPTLKRQDLIFCVHISPPGRVDGLLQVLAGV